MPSRQQFQHPSKQGADSPEQANDHVGQRIPNDLREQVAKEAGHAPAAMPDLFRLLTRIFLTHSTIVHKKKGLSTRTNPGSGGQAPSPNPLPERGGFQGNQALLAMISSAMLRGTGS